MIPPRICFQAKYYTSPKFDTDKLQTNHEVYSELLTTFKSSTANRGDTVRYIDRGQTRAIRKALSPIFITLFGMVTEVSLLQS